MLPEKELQSKSVSNYIFHRLPSDFIFRHISDFLSIIRPDRFKKYSNHHLFLDELNFSRDHKTMECSNKKPLFTKS